MNVLEMFENKNKFMALNPNFQPENARSGLKKDPLESAHTFLLENRELNDEQMDKFKEQFSLE